MQSESLESVLGARVRIVSLAQGSQSVARVAACECNEQRLDLVPLAGSLPSGKAYIECYRAGFYFHGISSIVSNERRLKTAVIEGSPSIRKATFDGEFLIQTTPIEVHCGNRKIQANLLGVGPQHALVEINSQIAIDKPAKLIFRTKTSDFELESMVFYANEFAKKFRIKAKVSLNDRVQKLRWQAIYNE